ncbi:MAG TPA: SidA/IucD/PvdA family monooxygenase [Streptosporangiaceae bacterium]|jgi:lysine N6-hydroxylase|nr:SidA/IucD/PvdA family monooxygenase [Streptosporangiaceae bacterium]
MSSQEPPYFHTAGVGAGPANLSLAALFEVARPDRLALFEASPEHSWHGNLLFPGVRMQTAWIKDLVSLVDPGHRLSFLSYLVATKRVFPFLSAQYDEIPRLEFSRYLEWAAGLLPDVSYGTPVDEVTFESGFVLHSGGHPVARSDHLVIGVGSRAQIPAGLDGLGPGRVVVADELGPRLAMKGDGEVGGVPCDEPVAVIGCGQTGAECVVELRRRGFTDIRWLGSRSWFAPMDDSPTANEMFRPAYSEFLDGLPFERRRELAKEHVLTSDGISTSTLRTVFQDNYEELLRGGRAPVTLLPGRRVVAGRPRGRGLVLSCQRAQGPERQEVRFAVVAAGRRPAPLPFGPKLREMIDTDDLGAPTVETDYSLRWKHGDRHKIFVQNRSRYAHGLQDSNLSLIAVRSAIIINSLFERPVFDISDEHAATVWD